MSGNILIPFSVKEVNHLFTQGFIVVIILDGYPTNVFFTYDEYLKLDRLIFDDYKDWSKFCTEVLYP